MPTSLEGQLVFETVIASSLQNHDIFLATEYQSGLPFQVVE
jgi:hypothetical protein